ncbi:agmatinase [Motiliproteus sp. SC1-56]|uniref:agmatinase n=1 Tax=Motiliproteus sp. SC1-56 TaxID=2799565 RepID=UPI001A8DAB16|nr:agmatinase [Motiliproteus sp. SC1-56]
MDEFDQWAAPEYPVFLGSEIQQAAPNEAAFHVIPVPYEESVSYGGGTGDAPRAILKASWQLETWDGKSTPAELGIHTQPPVVVDGPGQQVIDNIAAATRRAVEAGAMPVALGGEHTVTYGVIEGLRAAGIRDFGVVQIDAHADLREAYQGNPLSHASVMKRIVDRGVPLYQLGIRAYCHEEAQIRAQHQGQIHYRDADDLVPGNVNALELPDDFPEQVFFTVDVDGLDPSVFPSTGTPVPGGLGWYQTLSLFESVARQRKIIGFDVMEHAPMTGFHAYDFSAALLVYKLMGIVQRNR